MKGEPNKSNSKLPFAMGAVLSVLVLGLFVYLLFTEDTCIPDAGCVYGWDRIAILEPNELGDAFAGIAGSLAFVWILVTISLQSAELRAQREELELTRRELAASSKALQEQALTFTKQTELLVSQGEQRKSERAYDYALLRSALVKRYIVEFGPRGLMVIKNGQTSEITLSWPNNDHPRFFTEAAKTFVLIEQIFIRERQEGGQVLLSRISSLLAGIEADVTRIEGAVGLLLQVESSRLEEAGILFFLNRFRALSRLESEESERIEAG